MSRINTLAVVLALPAGVLLQLTIQAAAHMTADDVSVLSKMGVFTITMGAAGSAGVYGTKAAIERHEDTVRLSRHRRAPLPRQTRPPSRASEPYRGAGPEPEAVDQPALAEEPLPAATEPELPAGPPRPLDVTALDWPRPPAVDPYLIPASVDDDGYPTVTMAAVAPCPHVDPHADLCADLYAHPVPADATVVDGWDRAQIDAEGLTRGEAWIRLPGTPAAP